MTPPRRLDLRLLTSLEALLETRSVSRAAERMGLSQPAMSRVLARLRDQLSDPLLVRGRRGMVLTPRAEALTEPLRRWLSQGEDILRPRVFAPEQLERTFQIASTDFGILSVVRPAAAAISREAPGATLQVTALSRQSLQHLADGQLDLVIQGYSPEGRGLRHRKLFTEHRQGLCRQGHPALDADGAVDEEAFFAWPHVAPLIGDGLGEALADAPGTLSRRRLQLVAQSFLSIPFLLTDSYALSVLPSRATQHFSEVYGLAVFDPPVSLPTFRYFLVWHERSMEDQATAWLIETLTAAQPVDSRRWPEDDRPPTPILPIEAA